MTHRSDFTEPEWDLLRQAPASAGLIVATAAHGGTFRETLALGKAYAEAHKQPGQSELLDEIVAAKPKADHTHYHSPAELRQGGLQHLRDAVDVLTAKATADEVEDYRRFVLRLAEAVAAAHREDGLDISPGERTALDEIAESLGASPTITSS